MRKPRGATVFSKLRMKFMALNMASVAVVVALAFSAICAFDYKQDVEGVSQAISNSIDAAQGGRMHDGHRGGGVDNALAQNIAEAAPFQKGAGDQNADGAATPGNAADVAFAPSSGDEGNSSGESTAGKDDSGAGAPMIGGGQGQTIPVAVYVLDPNGGTVQASPAGTASIDDDLLETALSRLAEADDGTGSYGDLGLLYEKRTIGDTAYLAFADADSASGWKSLAITLAGVAVLALAAFFVISLFFSHWALRPAERAWRSQRQFIADASHELKTPLTVILANASIALEHPERSVESQRQWVEGIQAEGERMQSLVEDMLALAKHDTAEADSALALGKQRETLDLCDTARRAVLQFEAVAFERGVDIQDACEGTAPMRGARGDIERVLGVLIDNACKYAGAGGTVTVGAKREGKHAVLRVNDTGSPIDAESLAHVFDRFWRADEARTSGAGGYGLGLSIARSIVEEHGGTLVAESSAASGTTFTARFPIA